MPASSQVSCAHKSQRWRRTSLLVRNPCDTRLAWRAQRSESPLTPNSSPSPEQEPPGMDEPALVQIPSGLVGPGGPPGPEAELMWKYPRPLLETGSAWINPRWSEFHRADGTYRAERPECESRKRLAHVAASLRDAEWTSAGRRNGPFPWNGNHNRTGDKSSEGGGMESVECESRRDSPGRSRPPAGT